MKMPSTAAGALFSLLWRRASIQLTGIGLENVRDTIPPADATRIDTCWSVAAGLGLVDTIRGADFQARHMQAALEKGDPSRVARAVAAEACYVSTVGVSSAPRTTKLLDIASELATRLDEPRSIGFVRGSRGIVAFQQGRWREARIQCEEAEEILRERCQGVAWELTTALYFRLAAMVLLGEFKSLGELLPSAVREAEERGDLYRMIGLQTSLTNMTWLAADAPDEAERQVIDGMRRWSRRGYQIQHYQAWFAKVQILLYRRRAREAAEVLQEGYPALVRSFFLRIQFVRTMVTTLMGRVALADACMRPVAEREPFLIKAQHAVRKLERERSAWATALAESMRAQLAVARDRPDEAVTRFAAAATALKSVDLHLDAACAMRAHGLLAKGDAGRAHIAEAEQWMAKQRIAAIEPMFATILPSMAQR
jgi:hypothetical protein